MGDVLWIVLAGIVVLIGAIGVVAPILPGLPVSWLGLLVLKFIPTTQNDISWQTLIVLGVLTVIVTILDNVLPVWGTKKLGGNKQVVWGATIGLLFGFFMGPWGIILGPFVGAFAGGLLSGTQFISAVKQATGAFFGYIMGLVMKLVTVGLIVFFFVKTLVF